MALSKIQFGNLGRRNLVINGAMNVAQRGVTLTDGTNGYTTTDRFRHASTGMDNDPTHENVNVASGTTPYSLGFRKAHKVTNGNQSSGAEAGDNISVSHRIEGQNIHSSGWDHTSSSSYITLSFWVKSSVSQSFYIRVRSFDGTNYNYVFETGVLTADTWTKITKSIPGNSNIQIDNDNGLGLQISWDLFQGTDFTDNSVSLNQWGVWDNVTRTPDQTTTWYTTDNATFELTGVQLEAGNVATPFEHRSYGEEVMACQRYYIPQLYSSESGYATGSGQTARAMNGVNFPVVMRDAPDITVTTNTLSNGTNLGASGITNQRCHLTCSTNGSGSVYWTCNLELDAEI